MKANKDIVSNLKKWLVPVDDILKQNGEFVLDRIDETKHRIFIDRGSAVLFIAHMDTIHPPKYVRQSKSKKTIFAQGLDDRLGCMLAFDLSKELEADLLLTDHEERGGTTAKFHKCKDYNWIVEFDRAGNDVVTYGKDSVKFLDALGEYWPKIGYGCYSDICEVKTSACCFNLGVGYDLPHSKDSYMVVKTMDKQIELFRKFYHKYKDVKFERESDDIQVGDHWECLGNDDFWDNDNCDICGMPNAKEIYDYFLCTDCVERMVYEQIADKEDCLF